METHRNYYQNYKIDSMADLKSIFPRGEADVMNWCVFSTSGVHGTYLDLDTIEEYYQDPETFVRDEHFGEPFTPKLTVLVIKPRIVSMLYGQIDITQEDIPFLRRLCQSSLEAIRRSQAGNFPKQEGSHE